MTGPSRVQESSDETDLFIGEISPPMLPETLDPNLASYAYDRPGRRPMERVNPLRDFLGNPFSRFPFTSGGPFFGSPLCTVPLL